MFYDDLESTISNLGFWKTLSFPPQSFYLFFNCLLKNIFRFLPIAAITITQMPSIQNNMAPLVNWWITTKIFVKLISRKNVQHSQTLTTTKSQLRPVLFTSTASTSCVCVYRRLKRGIPPIHFCITTSLQASSHFNVLR